MANQSSGLGRLISLLGKHEDGLRHARHVTRRLTGSWSGYSSQMLGLSKSALQSGDYVGWLRGSTSAAATAYSTAFDAWAGLFGAVVAPHQTATAGLTFDGDSEMAGPEVVDLSQLPRSATPRATNLVLVGGASVNGGPAVPMIPSENVIARLDGETLRITLVNLQGIQPPLVFGEYAGDIDLGGNMTVPVSATYTGGCSTPEQEDCTCGCTPCSCCCSSSAKHSEAIVESLLDRIATTVSKIEDEIGPGSPAREELKNLSTTLRRVLGSKPPTSG